MSRVPLSVAALVLLAGPASAQQPPPADPDLPPKVKYQLGPDSLPQEGVPRGELVGPTAFRSKAFGGTARQYWVYVPHGHKPDAPACLLVLQDGQRATNPKGSIRVQTVLDNLIHRKAIPPVIGVFVTPGQQGDDYPPTVGTGNANNRSVEYDSLGDAYSRFLHEHLLPEVEKTHKLSNKPADRAIGGFSSGAICAWTVAWERPDSFGRVYSAIGSFTNLRGGHVYPDLIREADRKPIRVFLQDGLYDNRSPRRPDRDWYLQNRKMVEALRERGYDYKFALGAGEHADDHGGVLLPDALRWLWRDHPAIR